ncbi:hypothetical protein SESBI_45884 [Sesbania bispinosa]|nr:hypothetical protein SESBI_45884 [Sesbania bispinosa]
MQGSKSVVKLNGGPPLEINNVQKSINSKTGMFSEKRCITYTIGKRLLSLNITKMGCDGRVNVVYLDLNEINGKGSSANLNLRVIKNERYGVLCNINSKLAGSYDSFKENYSVPPLPDTELICYVCRETGTGGCFTLEKKKLNSVIVDSVKASHAFVIDDDLIFNVKIKIRDMRDGLSVVVEGPVKLTMDYTKQVMSRIRGKMESEMDASMLFHFKNAIPRLPSNGDIAYDSM